MCIRQIRQECALTRVASSETLRSYFLQFGKISSSSIMRDPAGRSRGFAFLTFEDPASVNAVVVKEHVLDGKRVTIKLNRFLQYSRSQYRPLCPPHDSLPDRSKTSGTSRRAHQIPEGLCWRSCSYCHQRYAQGLIYQSRRHGS